MAILIREVWNENLEEEFALIRENTGHYNYVIVAMDLDPEIPVHHPPHPFIEYYDSVQNNYLRLAATVDLKNLMRVGLTLSDEDGNLPNCGTERPCVWQFNFIEQPQSQPPPPRVGIDISRFQELLISSSLVRNDQINWVTHRGGDDLCYILMMLTNSWLPRTLPQFFELIKMYFPSVHDINDIF